MRKTILLFTAFLSLSLSAQNRVNVEKKTIANGLRNSLTVKVPYFEKSAIKSLWKNKMKEFGGKSSISNYLQETLVIKGILNPKVTNNAYNTFTKLEDPITDTLTIITAVQFSDGTFLEDKSHEAYPEMEVQLLDFCFDLSKTIYNSTLSDSQKELDKANKSKMKLEIENSKLLASNDKQASTISIHKIKKAKYEVKIIEDSLNMTKDNLSAKKRSKLNNRLIKNTNKAKKHDYSSLKAREKTVRNNAKLESNIADIKTLDEKITHYQFEVEKFKNHLNNLKR